MNRTMGLFTTAMRRRVSRSSVAALIVALVGFLTRGYTADAPAPVSPTFEKDILPIFQAKCLRCHGEQKPKAKLDLRTKATILKGGETGPALVPGAAPKSLLWEKVSDDKMPPDNDKLTAAEKALIRAWIDGGARDNGGTVASKDDFKDRQVTDEDRQFWSFRKPIRPAVSKVRHADRVRNPIDAFLLAKLEAKGLSFSAEA